MNSHTEQLENNQVKLLVEIPEEELAPDIEQAFQKVARQVRLPGFRPGKAPRRVLEAKLGRGFARAEAINDNAGRWAEQAIIDNEVEAISRPAVTVTEGEEEGPLKIDVVVEVRPEYVFEGYGDLRIEFPAPNISDDEVAEQIERLREAFGNYEDSEDAIGETSVATIDFEVTAEGSDPSTVTDYVLRIGAAEPVEGLAAALSGKSVGDTFEFEAPATVEGEEPRKVTGTVKAHQSLVKPELDDDFAKDVSEFESIDELREDVRTSLGNFRRSLLRNSWRQVMANALSEAAGITDLPGSLVQREYENLSHDFGHRIENTGLSFAKYLEVANTTADELSSRLASEAVIETRLDLALRALANAEGLAATDDEVDEQVAQIANASGMDTDDARERLRLSGQLFALRAEIAKRKALDWVFDNAKLVDDKGNDLTRSDITGEAPKIEEAQVEVEPEVSAEAAEAAEDDGEEATE
ncbi:MAG: trigger factor [Actinomycetota bacterium]|nr:trigger factor [Actinomycetota bacterium]MDA8397424.1 trigger factor [Actinomycetota bacterium]